MVRESNGREILRGKSNASNVWGMLSFLGAVCKYLRWDPFQPSKLPRCSSKTHKWGTLDLGDRNGFKLSYLGYKIQNNNIKLNKHRFNNQIKLIMCFPLGNMSMQHAPSDRRYFSYWY